MDEIDMLEIAEKAKAEFIAIVRNLPGFLSVPIRLEVSETKTNGKAAAIGLHNGTGTYQTILCPPVIHERFDRYGLDTRDQQEAYVRYLTAHELSHIFTQNLEKQLIERYPEDKERVLEVSDAMTDCIAVSVFPEFKEYAEREYGDRYTF